MAKTLPRLTMAHLVTVFGVSHITIINWKNPKEGVAHRKEPLPSFKDEQTGRVTYNARAVAAWAKKNDVPMKKDPVAIAEKLATRAEKAAAPKPGPRPRAAKKEAAKPARKRSKPIKKALVVASEKVQKEDARKATEEARDKARIESKRAARKAPARKPRAPKDTADSLARSGNLAPDLSSDSKPQGRSGLARTSGRRPGNRAALFSVPPLSQGRA